MLLLPKPGSGQLPVQPAPLAPPTTVASPRAVLCRDERCCCCPSRRAARGQPPEGLGPRGPPPIVASPRTAACRERAPRVPRR